MENNLDKTSFSVMPVKKLWNKPGFELINKGIVQGGTVVGHSEGQRTATPTNLSVFYTGTSSVS